MAESDAHKGDALADDIEEAVRKALSFTNNGMPPGCTRMLFHWDVVYSDLTIVYTDDRIIRDAHAVTKCLFPKIDERVAPLGDADETAWEQELDRISANIRTLLERALGNTVKSIPAGAQLCFSDKQREHYDPADYPITLLLPSTA